MQTQTQNVNVQQHPVNPEKPLDSVLAGFIEESRRAGRGFALGVVRDMTANAVTYRVEQSLPPMDTREKPTPYRAHTIEDVTSLALYAKRYGNPERSVVFYNDTLIELVLDDEVVSGERETIELEFAYSREWDAWSNLVEDGGEHEHKRLMTFLLLHQHTIVNPTIIDSMRSVRATFQANYESDLRLDAATVGVLFKATAGDELVRFPREFTITVPVLDIDVMDKPQWVTVPIRLEVSLPDGPQKPVLFRLLAPTLESIRRVRIDSQIELLRGLLPGWLIVRGSHCERPRVLGPK